MKRAFKIAAVAICAILALCVFGCGSSSGSSTTTTPTTKAKDFDGASVTYIYVDGMESMKGNMGKSQRSIDLKGDSLSTGRHTVEAVQFQGDSPSGTVKLYKKSQYEVA